MTSLALDAFKAALRLGPALGLGLTLTSSTSCSGGPTPEGPKPPRPDTASSSRPPEPQAAPTKPTLRVFLRGCGDYRLSKPEGATFLHFRVAGPNSGGEGAPTALRILPDGAFDRAASARAETIFGRFPERAWAQPPPAQWVGGRWAPVKPPEGVTPIAWLPWAGGRVVVVGRQAGGGTAVFFEGSGAPPPGFVAPPELARLEPHSAISLPEAPTLLIYGTLNKEASYVAVAGSVRALIKNDAGNSLYALPPHPKDRLLVSHRPPGAQSRAVRVTRDRVAPAEPFPAAPAALAADDAGVEWLLSADGELYRHEPAGSSWDSIAQVSALGLRRTPTLAPGNGGLWLSFRGGVFFVRPTGEVDSIALPPEIDAGLASADVLGIDGEGRLWVAAWVGARSESFLLTTGPAPAKFGCDEVMQGL